MSARSFSTLFKPWTCCGCLEKGRTIAQRAPLSQTLSRLPRRWNHTHTSSQGQSGSSGGGRRTGGGSTNGRRQRQVLLASTAGGGLVATALAFNDEAKYIANAAQRTSRVVTTLFICINDYRVTLKHDHANREDYEALLKACHKRCAERTLVAMEKNGSIFIKLGQHLSSLNYLLPSEWCDTFIPLQDKCPVSSYESIEEMVMKDTGRQISEYFSEFEKEPIGAASLAQVHRAVVRETGEHVAVKVQHPSLDEWAPLDLKLTHFTFTTLKRWFPDYDLTWLSEEMEISLPQELDFKLEGENARTAKEYFSHVKEAPLIIPGVRWADRRILVMEYVTGHRPDDLDYLDSHGIDRDEVSAALARIFNEMIFGTGAPLHCDPHGGNIAIRHNPHRWGKANFDIILYDHGLYRTIPMGLRRSYAKLWLAVLDGNEQRMRTYAKQVAGIDDDMFPLFASAITGRDYAAIQAGVASQSRTAEEKENITDALGEGLLAQLVQLLGKVPRVLLLILKTNDLTRSLDENLHTRQGSVRTFLILARYASRAVYEEQLENIKGFSPRSALAFLQAWIGYIRLGLKLSTYELYLDTRRLLGMQPITI